MARSRRQGSQYRFLYPSGQEGKRSYCAYKFFGRGKYKIVFNTDDIKYGGDGKIKKKILSTVARPSHGKKYSIPIDMPALTCIYLVREEEPIKVDSAKNAGKKTAKPNGGRK